MLSPSGKLSHRLALATALTVSALTTPAQAAPPADGAQAIFTAAQAICARDAGALWGRPVCGPILLVDWHDSAVIANQADPGGLLQPDAAHPGQFTGKLPPDAIIANTPVEWSGTRWTELLWPLPDDPAHFQVMLAHELFHRVQPDLGLTRPDVGNQHLDTLEGRYLLQLEWRALAKALQAPTPVARKAAFADAYLFRHERYRLFPDAAREEADLEINEGVPEYTGVRLGLTTAKARLDYAVRDLSAFVAAPTFVRSFAYATGPAYGLMLDDADPQWRTKLAAGPGLDQRLATAINLPPPNLAPKTLKARQAAYDPDAALRTAELKRDAAKQAHLAALKARLVDGPVLTLPLHKISYQFNPQTLESLGAYGIVYPTLRLTSDWGVLEVDDGALLDKAKTVAAVSAAGVSPGALKGPGWKLTLKPGWGVVAGVRAGDLAVRAATPTVGGGA